MDTESAKRYVKWQECNVRMKAAWEDFLKARECELGLDPHVTVIAAKGNRYVYTSLADKYPSSILDDKPPIRADLIRKDGSLGLAKTLYRWDGWVVTDEKYPTQ